jgi:hypothetical protein
MDILLAAGVMLLVAALAGATVWFVVWIFKKMFRLDE